MDSGGKRGLPEMRKSAMAFPGSYRLRGHHTVRGRQCEGSEEDFQDRGNSKCKGQGGIKAVLLEAQKESKSLCLEYGEQEREREEMSGERQAEVRSYRALQALGRNWILS